MPGTEGRHEPSVMSLTSSTPLSQSLSASKSLEAQMLVIDFRSLVL